jgi:hypothetical protein
MVRMRPLNELVDVDDPAWPDLLQRFAAASVPVRHMHADGHRGHACLARLQVTARSTLGALALHCGGLLLDDGWLRVYGGAAAESPGALPGLEAVNGCPHDDSAWWRPEAGIIVAHDVLGGAFALNGIDPAAIGRPGEPGEMVYFAPDSLAWEALDIGHTDWLRWALAGGLAEFYAGMRWPSWRTEAQALDPSQGISVVPFLWSEQAQQDLAATSRRPVPLGEVVALNREAAGQLNGVDPGFLGWG